MSRENVEQTKRAAEAYNRRDVEAMLEELDPEVEWHSALSILLSGKATVYRGHDGVREWFRELDDASTRSMSSTRTSATSETASSPSATSARVAEKAGL
jgi:ketosteroid isomerase-like protein